MIKFDEKMSISLTKEDKQKLTNLADADFRLPTQMASIIIHRYLADIDNDDSLVDENGIDGSTVSNTTSAVAA